MSIYLLFFFLAQFSLSNAWSYKDQDKWPELCQKGLLQSPIALVTSEAIPCGGKALIGKNWDKDYNVTIKNTGHEISISFDNKDPITLTGGGLPGTFNFFSLEFHWKSEHTLDGQRKALEAHFVLYNNKFSCPTEALRYLNGKAALSVLYNLAKEDNDRLAPIVEQLGKLKKAKSRAKLTLNPRKLLPDNLSEYFRYWGSMPKPGCNEVVVWSVFSEPCNISEAQVNAFASIQGSDGQTLSENYRKIQPLNDRLFVKYSTTGPSF